MNRNYQSVLDRDPGFGFPQKSWSRFFVVEAGKSTAAQKVFVEKLTGQGHTRVTSAESCHYYVTFCPISTRVGTDVCQALSMTPGDKPAILIVMHHSRLPDYFIPPSERLVDKANVVLTVDIVFFDGNLVPSERNDQAWDTIRSFIWGNRPKTLFQWLFENPRTLWAVALFLCFWFFRFSCSLFNIIIKPGKAALNYIYNKIKK